MRTRPGRSVTKSRPSGARSTAHGARSPDATSWTFSTTAGPTRGDAVGVVLAVEGAALVGIGIFVIRGDVVDSGGAMQDTRKRATSVAAARVVARGSGLSSVGVF